MKIAAKLIKKIYPFGFYKDFKIIATNSMFLVRFIFQRI